MSSILRYIGSGVKKEEPPADKHYVFLCGRQSESVKKSDGITLRIWFFKRILDD